MGDSAAALNIMPESRIRRAIRRMAMQIVESSRENTRQSVLIGLNERGFSLASLLSTDLAEITGHTFTCVPFEVSTTNPLLPDDLRQVLRHDAHVILVDDVLFSGRTMMRAIREVLQAGDPASVRLAVLIDRGHRTYPIQPDFVGLVSPTKLREHVEVHFGPSHQPLGVFLSER